MAPKLVVVPQTTKVSKINLRDFPHIGDATNPSGDHSKMGKVHGVSSMEPDVEPGIVIENS
jgi:hypothetical protein